MKLWSIWKPPSATFSGRPFGIPGCLRRTRHTWPSFTYSMKSLSREIPSLATFSAIAPPSVRKCGDFEEKSRCGEDRNWHRKRVKAIVRRRIGVTEQVLRRKHDEESPRQARDVDVLVVGGSVGRAPVEPAEHLHQREAGA